MIPYSKWDRVSKICLQIKEKGFSLKNINIIKLRQLKGLKRNHFFKTKKSEPLCLVTLGPESSAGWLQNIRGISHQQTAEFRQLSQFVNNFPIWCPTTFSSHVPSCQSYFPPCCQVHPVPLASVNQSLSHCVKMSRITTPGCPTWWVTRTKLLQLLKSMNSNPW